MHDAPSTYEKSFGEPNHIKGVKKAAITKNQKQKLTLGNTFSKSSWKICEDKSKYTVPAPNKVKVILLDTRTL